MPSPPQWAIVTDYYSDIAKLKSHMVAHGLPASKPCPRRGCRGKQLLLAREARLMYRCNSSKCSRSVISAFAGTPFLGFKFKAADWWFYVTCFVFKLKNRACLFVGHSTNSYSAFRQKMCEICTQIMNSDAEKAIGGQGKVVQVDEYQFINKKSKVPGTDKAFWVIGGVEEESSKLFVEIVTDRSASTIMEVLQRRILPGTNLKTDAWRNYPNIANNLYLPNVTISQGLSNGQTANANKIRGLWANLKRHIIEKNGVTGPNLRNVISEGVFFYRFFDEDDPSECLRVLIEHIFHQH